MSEMWQSPSEIYSWFRMKRTILRFLKEELEGSGKGEIRVLDMGCGSGRDIFMLNQILKNPNQKVFFTGLDMNKSTIQANAQTARTYRLENVRFVEGDIEGDLRGLGRFDIVLSSEVIEHLHHPARLIENIDAILEPGGCAILSTPNKSNIFREVFKRLPASLKRQTYSANRWMEERRLGYGEEEPDPDFHQSYMGVGALREIVERGRLCIEKWERGSLVYGGEWLDRHALLFAVMVFLDAILPKRILPFGWDTVLKLKKRQ